MGRECHEIGCPSRCWRLAFFVVESFGQSKGAFWVTVYVSFALRNILQDDSCEDEIEIDVEPDDLQGAPVIGQLIESSLTCNLAQPPRVVHARAQRITAAQKAVSAVCQRWYSAQSGGDPLVCLRGMVPEDGAVDVLRTALYWKS